MTFFPGRKLSRERPQSKLQYSKVCLGSYQVQRNGFRKDLKTTGLVIVSSKYRVRPVLDEYRFGLSGTAEQL